MKLKLLAILFIFCFVQANVIGQNCDSPTAETSLNINNIDAGLLNGGDMFWDLNDTRYEYPKGSGNNLIFTAALWMGGLDDQGALKVAAQTYRQTGTDFFAGPIAADGTTDDTCEDFDRFWEVKGEDITAYLETWEENGGTIALEDIPASILEWPGRNSTTFTEFSLPIDNKLAPFWDQNADGNYDPLDGDYPVIDPKREGTYADQMIWWVYNDAGNSHGESGGEIIGVEIGVLAYAYQSDDYLNNTTFYRYTLNYTGSGSINDFYTALWLDPDLGNGADDYVGCDTTLNMGYVYNGTSSDAIYGSEVPVLGVKYLEDWNGNTGTNVEMSSFHSYNNDFEVTGNPESAQHYYNYTKGLWKDNSPITVGGNGYGGTETTNFMFPDSPDGEGWSECAENNFAGDRRIIMSIGPTTLIPNERKSMTFAVLVSPAEEVDYPCPNIGHLQELAVLSDSLYFDNFVFEEPIDTTIMDTTVMDTTIVDTTWAMGLENIKNLIGANVYPNPAKNYFFLEWDEAYNEHVIVSVFDITGRKTEQFSSNANQNRVDVSSWNTGMYFYEITNQQGQVLNTGKLLVE